MGLTLIMFAAVQGLVSSPRTPHLATRHDRCAVITCSADVIAEAMPAGTETVRIIKGRRIAVGENGKRLGPIASQGACIEKPIDPVGAAVVFTAAATLAYFGFQTRMNKEEGPDVPRRKAITWLALQSGAALSLGPQLTNPCSNINANYRVE